jgi:hypothetical protein
VRGSIVFAPNSQEQSFSQSSSWARFVDMKAAKALLQHQLITPDGAAACFTYICCSCSALTWSWASHQLWCSGCASMLTQTSCALAWVCARQQPCRHRCGGCDWPSCACASVLIAAGASVVLQQGCVMCMHIHSDLRTADSPRQHNSRNLQDLCVPAHCVAYSCDACPCRCSPGTAAASPTTSHARCACTLPASSRSRSMIL